MALSTTRIFLARLFSTRCTTRLRPMNPTPGGRSKGGSEQVVEGSGWKSVSLLEPEAACPPCLPHARNPSPEPFSSEARFRKFRRAAQSPPPHRHPHSRSAIPGRLSKLGRSEAARRACSGGPHLPPPKRPHAIARPCPCLEKRQPPPAGTQRPAACPSAGCGMQTANKKYRCAVCAAEDAQWRAQQPPWGCFRGGPARCSWRDRPEPARSPWAAAATTDGKTATALATSRHLHPTAALLPAVGAATPTPPAAPQRTAQHEDTMLRHGFLR